MSDRYEIKSSLGRGGMGTVYHAFDTVMKRDVAVKRLLPIEETKLNEAADDSLGREAAALARFSHPNIVTIFAFEEDEDGPFVVMEKVEGEDLKLTVKRGALAVDDFIELAEQTLDPLIAASELNLLHRDIKPANIMLNRLSTGKFQAKVLDFGVAKFSEKPQLQTLDQNGCFLGSIEFLSPDQLLRLPLDQRSDLYSLGCVLYFCLAQESPFRGDNPADTTQRHMKHVCENIHVVRPDLPGPMADWLMRMIARDRDDRPDDALMALQEFHLAKEGISPLEKRARQSQKGVVVISDSSSRERVVTEEDVVEEVGVPEKEDTGITGPRMILVGDKMQRTGPIESPVGLGNTSHTGPLRGGGSRAIPMTPAKSPALPIVLIVGGICLVIGLLAAVFNSKPKKPNNSPKQTVAKTPPAKEKPVVPKYKPTFPPRATADFVSPTSIDLPAPASIPGGGPPISKGLLAHYRADVATFDGGLKLPAKMNDRVAGWANLAPGALPENDLFLHQEDFEVRAVPRLVEASDSKFPELKSGTKVLEFQNSTQLRMPNWKTLEKEEISSFTVLAVVRNELRSSTWIRFDGHERGGFFTSNHGGQMLQGHILVNGKRTSSPIKLPLNEFVIVSFILDGEKKTQQVHGLKKDGSRVSSKILTVNFPPVKMRHYALGNYWRPQKGKQPPGFFKGHITELLIFSKAVKQKERESLENYLRARNFK